MAETSQVPVGGNFLEEILEETKASSPEVREVYKTGLSALLDDIVSQVDEKLEGHLGKARGLIEDAEKLR